MTIEASSNRYDLFVAAASYLVLSLLCAFVPYVSVLRDGVGYAWSWVWLFGPPALLLHGAGYLVPYVAATITVAAGAVAIKSLWRRHREWSLLIAGVELLLWLGWGGLVYVPNW